jgi:hypothetical protein
MIDTLEMYDEPIYTWGRDTIVFDNWPDLLDALEEYRSARETVAKLGDWSPVISKFDPFRDGGAANRMGLYLSLLLDRIEHGDSPKTAMEMAANYHNEVCGFENEGR